MLDSISFFRVVQSGFVGFWRNIWLSLAATLVVSTTLVIFGVLFLMFGLTNYSLKTIENTVDVSAYFKTGLTEQQLLDVTAEVRKIPNVTEVNLKTAEQALAEFKVKHAGDELIAKSISELNENPLPATLNVKAASIDSYTEISKTLSGERFSASIAKVNFEDNRVIIERLGRILKAIVTFGTGLVIVFVAIAVLVIFNTITLTIYNRREEVEIMRLVGATNWYIRGPFLIESFLYSLFATIIAGAMFRPVFGKILPSITMYVNPQVTAFGQNIYGYWYLIGMMFAVAYILSTATTVTAMRRYLKI